MAAVTLVEFLRARLVDVEQEAARRRDYGGCCAGCACGCDPDSTLAQVAAHRAILERYELCKREGERNRALHEAWVDAGGSELGDGAIPDDPAARARQTSPFEEAGLLVAVQLLATMYADRDGWREEWRPE